MLRSGHRAKLLLAQGIVVTPSRASRQLIHDDALSHPKNRTQVYVSRSSDPFLNLSIEHRLLQTTPPDSTVLFLYTNSPCVVIGRNQNPWLEAGLARLAQIRDGPERSKWEQGAVRLVRRRSGGGTVFHDEGNANFSVICPPSAFHRDTHAEMVVRALSALGRSNTRVNERHDIVMDVVPGGGQTFKISGSAYKLTRQRALHHGTCLLRSPNLGGISHILRSPAEPFILARGVDSVRSPVANADVDPAQFRDAVVAEFASMYGRFDVEAEVGDEFLELAAVADGYRELQSPEWIYGQTPRFVFSTHPTEADPRERRDMHLPFKLSFEAKHGIIEQFDVESAPPRIPGPGHGRPRAAVETRAALDTSSFIGASLHDITDWSKRLAGTGMSDAGAGEVGAWMDEVMGTAFTKVRQQPGSGVSVH